MVLFLGTVLWVDTLNTRYLKIDPSDSASSNSYLITHANIVPMNQDTVLMNKSIYVENGVIEEIGDTLMVEGIPIFNAEHKFLLPGLMDMHVHVWDRYELGVYLSNGVTTIRNLWGMPTHLRMKKVAQGDDIYSPTFMTAGPKLTGSEFIGDDNLNLYSAEEARKKIISYKKRGYDLIKTYYGLEKEVFDAVIDQAILSELDIAAHPSQKVPYAYHAHPQIKSIEHAEDIVQQPLGFTLDTLKLEALIDSLSLFNHISFSPTLTVYNNIYQMMINEDILGSHQMGFMNPLIKEVDTKSQYDRWFNAKQRDSTIIEKIKDQDGFHREILRHLHDADFNIVASTDAGIGVTVPGFSLHQELAFYKQAGLSNYDVLRTATINASLTHTMLQNLGTIQVGKIANMLVLEKNPLEDITTLQRPSFIFIKGRILDRATLDGFEQKARDRKNLIATALRYLEYFIVEK